MPAFIWKATNGNGEEGVCRIEAADAAEARRILVARGLTNLRLQQDEFSAAAKEGVEGASNPEFHVELTPDKEAAYFDGKFPGFWALWWQSFRERPLWELGWLALAGWLAYRQAYGWAALAVTPLLLFPVISFWFGLPLRLYNQINQAKVWSRWPEVLTLVERLRRVQSWVKIGAPEWELSRVRAQALAATGRLPAALEEFGAWANQPGMESWIYKSHLASIYDEARKTQEALQLRLAATEEAPTNMSGWIDLCMHYAHRLQDVRNARLTQARIDESLVPELGRPYLELVEGMMRCLEGRFQDARGCFENAVEDLLPYQHNPLIQSPILLAQSYLCWALAGSGDIQAARRLWPRVERYLQPAHEDALIGKIQAFLGESPHP